MSDNIVKLASFNPGPRSPACTGCKHYHPDETWGMDGWRIFWWGPGFKPGASAMKYAVCSARGGEYASIIRSEVCHGDFFEDRQ